MTPDAVQAPDHMPHLAGPAEPGSAAASWTMRTILLGILSASLAYSLVTVYDLVTQSNGCLGAWRILSSCRSALAHLMVPGRHEMVAALLCSLAAMEACALATPAASREIVRLAGRRTWIVESALVALVLVALGTIVDQALHSVAAAGAMGLLLWAIWRASRSFAVAFSALDAVNGEPLAVLAANRVAARILLGIPIAFASAGIAARFAAARDMPKVSSGSVEVSAAIYVLTSIVLLAHTQFSRLRHDWKGRRAVIAGQVGTHWARYCALLITIVLLLALVSPGMATTATDMTGNVSDRLWVGLVGLVSHVGAPNFTVSCRKTPQACKRHAVRPDTRGATGAHLGRQHHGVSHHSDWLAIVRRVILWLTPILVIAFLFWSRGQQGIAGKRGMSALLAALRAAWGKLRGRSRHAFATLTDRLPVRLVDPAGSKGLAGIRRLTGWGDPSPREQILRYYLSTVGYARHHRISRHPAQTPEEFEHTLLQRLSEGHEAWAALTEDFLEARYSPHPLHADRARRTRENWQVIRAAIRATTRARTPSVPPEEVDG